MNDNERDIAKSMSDRGESWDAGFEAGWDAARKRFELRVYELAVTLASAEDEISAASLASALFPFRTGE